MEATTEKIHAKRKDGQKRTLKAVLNLHSVQKSRLKSKSYQHYMFNSTKRTVECLRDVLAIVESEDSSAIKAKVCEYLSDNIPNIKMETPDLLRNDVQKIKELQRIGEYRA